MHARTFAAAPMALLFVAGVARAEGDDRSLNGIYGGFALAGTIEPSGSGTELDNRCHQLGAASCSTPAPLGGGLFGYVGYGRAPYGLEVMFGGFGDYQHPHARYDGTLTPHVNPLLATPPRDESFILLRGGAVLAVRARYTWQNPRWRVSGAAGLGFSYKHVALEREVTSDSGLEDRPFFPSGKGYASPGVTLDGSVQLRLVPTTALMFGVLIWLETAGSGTRTDADGGRVLAGTGGLAAVATPSYQMASGSQLFVGPYIGLQFGP